MNTRYVAGLVVALALVGPPAARVAPPEVVDGFVVVVSRDNPLTTIQRDKLSKIFLKRVVTWPDDRPAEPVDLQMSDPVRRAFTKAVHGKSIAAVRAFWQQQIFSGRDVPPPEKGSVADVMEFVSTHAGAVGYLPHTATLGAGLKVIAIEIGSP